MKFLKVPRSIGESVRKELIKNDIFDGRYSVFSDQEFVFFPVKKEFSQFQVVEMEGQERPSMPSSLKEILQKSLSQEEFEQLIGSFDIIGDIAIIEVPAQLESKEAIIGQALLSTHKNLKSVFKKLGGMEGEFRTRPLKFVCGENNTETIYKESSLKIKLDVSKVYFSVRLSHERQRIAQVSKNGENVIVMFSGVGPFALVISKKNKLGKIVCIELNSTAVKYLEENIKLNKTKNIISEKGDVRDIVNKKYVNFADRIVMPLPHSAHEFLVDAFLAIKNGGIVHFYTIVESENGFDLAFKKAEIEAKKAGVQIEVSSSRIVRPYSPKEVQVVLDLLVSKRQ
ncbi:MAG: class I SAM-dependent methyltransferase [Candidatus Bilamarchaeum sp.]|jgi:tRNA (guanine37-N1)-methyltransferase